MKHLFPEIIDPNTMQTIYTCIYMSKPRIHIIKREAGWAVKGQGHSRASKIYETQSSAVEAANRFKERGHDVIVHRKDGTIKEWRKGS